MGRKRIRELKPLDRIGEEVDLEKCPECTAHPDCFSWMDGKCTALKSVDEGCVFYCPAEKGTEEAKAAYRKLRAAGRFDLIDKYIKSLTALGVFDDEIEECDRKAEELDAYREADFEALMKQVPGFSD